MTKFRVISEPFRLDRFSPTIPTHRRLRGDESVQRKVTVVEADNVFEALSRAVELGDHRKHSITSVEEVYPSEALSFTDEQLTTALSRPGGDKDIPDLERFVPEEYAGETVYDRSDFIDIVEWVAMLLGATLVRGMSLSIVGDFDDQYAVVEVRDAATGLHVSTTAGLKALTQDRSAAGWDGVLSIARALIATAGPLV